jgi:beta-xylosidase
MDAIPLIKARLAELEERGGHEALTTGRLAALWRAQARAARLGLTIGDLRRYCLDMLRARHALDDDDLDYLRGYREGFQLVLRDLRELE